MEPQAALQPIAEPTAGEPASTGMPYAGFWVRVFAALIDTVLVAGPILVLLVFGPMLTKFINSTAVATLYTILLLASLLWLLLSPFLYYARLNSSPKQGTIGKQQIGLIVTDEEGQRLTYGHALGRWFVEWLVTIFISLFAFITIPFSQRKQTVYDMLVRVVVRRRQ